MLKESFPVQKWNYSPLNNSFSRLVILGPLIFSLSGLWLARLEYQMFPNSQGTSSLIVAFEDPLTAPSHITKTAFASTTRLHTLLGKEFFRIQAIFPENRFPGVVPRRWPC